MQLPGGTVTFVLGDIEGSSRLWEQHGDRMAAALEELDGLVDSCVRGREGGRPLEQGEGDSFVAAFPTAADAVGFALELQVAIGERSFSGVAIAVRIGVHTGEALVGEGGIYRGEALNRCGRLRAVASGGQVLVSGTTADLVAAHLPDGAWLEDMGVHQLRDLARSERIHQLRHESLRAEFPPLSRPELRPPNLPVQLTSFVGRDREMAEIAGLLDRQRLVTLIGPGGAGKTRLALQVAAGREPNTTGAAWLVDLAPVAEPGLVVAAAAAAVGVREVPFQPLDETLRTRLVEQHALLVFDNCEHLVDAARDLAESLLRACPGLTVLATSREALGAEGEVTYPLAPLGLPSGADDHECDSLRLFVERAALARPGFRLTPETVGAVVEVCRRLDGIPLGIEMAAARCRLLSPAQIAAQLTDRFALLTGGRHSALPRQRTLEASLDWSHDLLSEDEQRLFRRLAVFAGGWTLEAAEAVCGPGEPEIGSVLESLAGLVDKSMVVVVVDDEELGARYRMLETMRHYGRERLVESGEAAVLRDRHLEYFVEVAQAAEAELRGPRMLATLGALERDIDNLRAVDDWAVESNQRDAALRLMGPLEEFWYRRHTAEGYRRVCTALAEPGGDPAARARACANAGGTAWGLGLVDEFSTHVGELEDLARSLDDERLQAIAGDLRGWAALTQGDGLAVEMFQRSIDRLEPLAETWSLIDSMWGLATARSGEGAHDEASRVATRALELARGVGNPMLVGISAGILGANESYRGQFQLAEPLLDEGIELTQVVEHDLFATLLSAYKAWLLDHRGDRAAASELLDDALTIAVRQQCVPSIGMLLFVRGVTEHHDRRFDAAAASFGEAESYLSLMSLWWVAAWIRALLAEAALIRGDVGGAEGQLREARGFTDKPFSGAARPRSHLAAGRVAHASSDATEGERQAHLAVSLDLGSGGCLVAVGALELLAVLAAERGDAEGAARLLASADSQRRVLSYPIPPVEQPAVRTAVETARAALDAAAYATAWSEGAAMNLDEAAAFVRLHQTPRAGDGRSR